MGTYSKLCEWRCLHQQIVPLTKCAGIDAQASQGVQPLVRNEVTQNSPGDWSPGCLPRRAHIQGFSLYRSAPFVPKGFHLCDQPLINISRNSIAPINFISRIIYFVNGRLQKLLNILWLRYAFACIGVFNQPHKRIKFQWDNLGLASISSDISDLI